MEISLTGKIIKILTYRRSIQKTIMSIVYTDVNTALLYDHHMGYMATLIHLLKGNVGAGLFAMGDAFKNSGIILGFFGTFFIASICVYNNHTLVRCSKAILEQKDMILFPTFADTICYSMEYGPEFCKKSSTMMRTVVKIFIIFTQLGFCIVYIAFVSQSLKDVVEGHTEGISWNIRVYTVIIFPVVTVICLIRTLKFLTPISFISNVCLFYGAIIIFIVIAYEADITTTGRKYIQDYDRWPLFVGTVVFAFEGIALTIPLRDEMKKKEYFDSTFGVLNVGMGIMMVLVLALGLLAYLSYGDEVNGSVTFNLGADLLSESVRGAVGLGILLTYPIQFYVAVKIINLDVEDLWGPFEHEVVIESIERIILIIITFLIALVVPHVDAAVSLIGAVCSNALALLLPAVADFCLRYGPEPILPKIFFRNLLNTIAIILSVVGMTTGAYVATKNIVELVAEEFSHSL